MTSEVPLPAFWLQDGALPCLFAFISFRVLIHFIYKHNFRRQHQGQYCGEKGGGGSLCDPNICVQAMATLQRCILHILHILFKTKYRLDPPAWA